MEDPRRQPRYPSLSAPLLAAWKASGLSIDELGDQAGVTVDQARDVFRGRTPNPPVVRAIAKALDVDLSALVPDLWVMLEALVNRRGVDDQAVLLDGLIRRGTALVDRDLVPIRRAKAASGSPLPKVRQLFPDEEVVPRDGIEPPTRGSSDRCSTNWFPRVIDGLKSASELAASA